MMNDDGWRDQCLGDQCLGHQCLEEGPPVFLFLRDLAGFKMV